MVKVSCCEEIFRLSQISSYLSWIYTHTMMLRLTQNMLIIKNGLKVHTNVKERRARFNAILKEISHLPVVMVKSTVVALRKCVIKKSMRWWCRFWYAKFISDGIYGLNALLSIDNGYYSEMCLEKTACDYNLSRKYKLNQNVLLLLTFNFGLSLTKNVYRFTLKGYSFTNFI